MPNHDPGASCQFRFQFRLIEIEQIDSTNSEALRRAAAGETGPLWIRAKRQTHGRGRSGRAWLSGEGDLAATLLFDPCCEPALLHQLALVAGIAVHAALTPLLPTGAGVRLKWPNDVLVGEAKLGGILVETSTFAGRPLAAIGVGINIAEAPDVPGRNVTSLIQCAAKESSPSELLQPIAEQMEHWLRIWQSGAGFASIRRAWLDRAGHIGEPMTVNTGSSTVNGTFAGIDETGALLLQGHDGGRAVAPHKLQRFTFGDVTLTPRAAAEG